jgi:PAS domain S-box-containing protein
LTDRRPEGSEAAEAMFRAVFENAQDGIVIVDHDGRFIDANPALAQVLGVSREQMLGRRPEEFLPGANRALVLELRRRVHEEHGLRGEFAFDPPGRERRWVEFTASPDFLPGRHLAVIRDCTERRRDHQALERRAAQQVAIAELSLMALERPSPEALVEAVEARIAQILDMEHVAIVEDARPRPHDVAIRSRDSVWGRLEVRSPRPSALTGEDLDFLHAVANILGLALAAAADDAELRRRSAEIDRLAAARQQIVAEALAAEDRAREGISQQLHDELLQSLFVIRQDLAEIAQDPERSDLVLRARDALHAAIGSLRAVVFDIHPVVLERSGLRSAVGAVAQHQAGLGDFEIEVDVAPEADGEHARLLLSLVRELLSNVARHADARHAGVRLWRERGEVRLEVCDDGRGLDREQARSAVARGHIGLASAVQRVEALSGRLDLSARSGGGTCVRVSLPLARQED